VAANPEARPLIEAVAISRRSTTAFGSSASCTTISASSIEHDGPKAPLPAERHYLIHPALDDIIAQASSDYIRAFHTRNVIGHGNRWREGKIFKCAAKGDLNSFSRVLSDPVVGEHFTRYLGSEFEKCKKEVEYAALESGDSVVLVDDSADRVLSAARSLRRSENPAAFGTAVPPAAVIRKNDHEEPVETRLFQAPLG
jgi:hypothetical protein